jgi:hypothetical protein
VYYETVLAAAASKYLKQVYIFILFVRRRAVFWLRLLLYLIVKETTAEFQKVMTFESLLLKDTHVNVALYFGQCHESCVKLMYTVASYMPIFGRPESQCEQSFFKIKITNIKCGLM